MMKIQKMFVFQKYNLNHTFLHSLEAVDNIIFNILLKAHIGYKAVSICLNSYKNLIQT